jgi:hypothetical protein
MGIVTGRWIVSTAWVEACLAACAAQPEADFEVVKDSAGFSNGPILGRLRVAEGSQLLHGYEVRHSNMHPQFAPQQYMHVLIPHSSNWA